MTTDETILHENTLRLRDLYVELDGVVDEMLAGKVESGTGMQEVRQKMHVIRATESVLGPCRERYLAENSKMPTELKGPTDITIETLENLMTKLAVLEKRTHDRADELRPKLHANVRAVQMQSAYHANLRE